MKRKWIVATVLLLFVLAFSTGCIDGQVDVNIKGDGSAEITYGMIVDKRTYDPELFEDYLQKLEDSMFVVEKRDMGEIILVNASVYLPRFRTVFDPLIAYDEEVSRIPIDFDKTWLRTEYRFDFAYDMEKAKQFIKEELDLDEVFLDGMAFSVRLPNSGGESNADSIEDDEKTFFWALDLDGTTDIFLKTNTINQINLVVTIGVPILALVAYFNDRRKKKARK